MKRAEILKAARVCVCGERERDYGTPENNSVCQNVWEKEDRPLPEREENI